MLALQFAGGRHFLEFFSHKVSNRSLPRRECLIKGRGRTKTKRNCGRGLEPDKCRRTQSSSASGTRTRFRRRLPRRGVSQLADVSCRPPPVPGTSLWGRSLEGNSRLADRAKSSKGAQPAVTESAATGIIPDFLARTDSKSCCGS